MWVYPFPEQVYMCRCALSLSRCTCVGVPFPIPEQVYMCGCALSLSFPEQVHMLGCELTDVKLTFHKSMCVIIVSVQLTYLLRYQSIQLLKIKENFKCVGV